MAPTLPSVPAVIDHVAHAVERWELAWPRYVTELGGTWASGGAGPGFAPSQLRFAHGARLEVLAPNDVHVNPFLRRFLDRNGPGPHHLTFKVPDLDAALEAVERHGLQAINVDRSDPDWQEAFIHPRQAGGIVVQLAQAAGSWESPVPEGFPHPAEPPASLVRATHAVADLAAATALFGGLLGGSVRPAAAGEPGQATATAVVDVNWDAPLGLRLVGPAQAHQMPPALSEWLRGAPGRLHHLVFSQPAAGAGAAAAGAEAAAGDAGALASGAPAPAPAPAPAGGDSLPLGVLPGDGAVTVVPPDANLGLGLVLTGPRPPAWDGGQVPVA
jgi:catechol 2,3-dioxygenase-like lactoylglutathione lyase family enzyme